MNCEEALEFTDALVFAKTGKHLSDLQRLLLKGSWGEKRLSYNEMADTYGYSATYFKQDVGPKLWQLLSEVCGEKVCKTSFRAAILRQTHLHYPSSPIGLDQSVESEREKIMMPNQDGQPQGYQDWGEAPDVSLFYGRTQELTQLKEWLFKERCRLIAVLGMGGMGKTHLSVKLAKSFQNEFDYIIFRSLSHAPPLQQILTNLLQILSKGQELELPVTVDEKISQLINYFRKHRCLLLLDNMETILLSEDSAGNYRENYQDYSEFFQRLGECHHNSCLVLTSREKPKEIALMEGETLPVRSLNLQGLTVSAGLELLRLKGCHWQEEQESKLLIEKYRGNPLALKIVCAAITDLFEGNISEFIKHHIFVFDEIYALLEEQFQRISPLGQTFLYWLAIEQEPISAMELKADIFPPISQQNLIENLKLLVQHSWIEKTNNLFSLQPVVKEYLLHQLTEQISQEIATNELVLLNQFALLKADSQEYMRNAQVELVIKPIIQKLSAVFRNKCSLEKQLRQIISKLQLQSPQEPGYAAGNILNLFCQLQTDLKGYDFSYLTVWQAYLQNQNLLKVNFAHADLAKSVFAKQLTSVLSVAFSPDGQLLATGDVNGEVCFWQVADSKLLRSCKGHAGWVHDVTFSPDGYLLSSASSDHTVKLWSVSDGKCVKTLCGHNQRVRSVAFSPDGHTLASGSSDYTIRLWDVNSGQCLKIMLEHKNSIWSVTFSPDGMKLASGSEDKTLKLWDVGTGKCLQTLSGHTRWIRSVAFSPDGMIIASGSGDHSIKVWDLLTGRCLKTLEGHTQRIRSVIFSPDGELLASGAGDHTIRLWDWRQGRCLKTLHGHSNRLGAVAFSPDGTILASGSEDRAVKLWEVHTGKCLKTWQGYASWIQSVAFSSDGNILASASEDRTIRLWHLHDGVNQPKITTLLGHQGWVCSVSFSPDNQLLATASSDYSIKLWDLASGICLKTLLGHKRWIRSVTFSPDGTQLVSGSGDYTLKLWDVATGQCLKTFLGHDSWLWSVAFSPDGQVIASGSEDKTVKLWEVASGKCLRTLKGHTSWVQSVAFSPDGQTIASSSCDGSIRLWTIATGECLKTFWGHTSWVQSVAFSPDGQTIASGSCDRTIKLWHIATGECQQTLQGHHSWVWSIAFSPDGQNLASGSQDETIKIWQLPTGKCLKTLRTQRPYEGMDITQAQGLTEAQRATLKALGAVEVSEHAVLARGCDDER